GDQRWVRLHCNFPHHAAAALRALGCANTKEAVTQAVRARNAIDVEESALANGGASGAARSREEWLRHPHFAAIDASPLIGFERAGDAKPKLSSAIRVLDLTRVIAGPVAGKALAGYGAEVYHVGSSRLPTIEALDVDHGFGKRACDIDITTPEGAGALRELIAASDVVLESYRPGALASHGFGFEDVRKLRPDIVYLSLSAYGDAGPWAGRRGFDSIVQLTSAVAITDPSAKPHPLPCQGLDHGTGYLAAFAIGAALLRRATEGGAWRIKVSLCRTAELLWDLGLHDHLQTHDPTIEDVRDLLEEVQTVDGAVVHVPIPGTIGGRDFRGMPPLISSSADAMRSGSLPGR
ncbi:MAG: CoA transferase, partial [Candidatus Eremiobacteraeota bacterium]|nr:CoA transferase [Candidatus Eremiobacteraeota bacterium]